MAEKIKLGTNGNFGVKEGGTLAYNDENGVFKAIELASSRASGATYVAESGIIADAESGVPRIDWTNGVGELLLEPQSSNLVVRSDEFNLWNIASATLLPNNSLSPDGSVNADRITTTASGGSVFLSQSGSGDYTFSVFLKYVDIQYVRLRSTSTYCHFDILNGTIVDASKLNVDDAKIEDYGNGWYRCSITGNNTNTIVQIFPSDSSSGSPTGTGSVDLFGAQFEALSYPTSYIRTSGSAVTRIADAVTGNSSLGQVINSSEGVLYVEMSALASAVSGIRALNIDDTTNSNRVFIQFDSASNGVRAGVVSGGTPYVVNDASVAFGNIKVALKYSQNDLALWINGVEVDTELIAPNMPSGLKRLNNGSTAGAPFYGRIKELKVYDTALTDAELTTLTTI